jgi:oxygen-dependent protoporphyrinogen oxidase
VSTAQRPEVVVVGGGVAGLCAAYELTGGAEALDDGPIVSVIDAAASIGGKLQALELDGRRLDAGPDGVLARRPELTSLCTELGIADQLVPIATSGASVYARGQLRALPEGLVMGVPTDLASLRASRVLSTTGYLRVLRDRVAPVPASRGPLQDRAIGNLVETKLGKEVVRTLVDPMLGGINAGRVAEMSAAAVFPPLLEAGQQRGSLMAALKALTEADRSDDEDPTPPAFVTLAGGMHQLIAVLRQRLLERDVRFLTSTAVTRLHRLAGSAPCWSVDSTSTTTQADGVVLALPASPASKIVAGLDAELSSLLAAIDYASVAIVTFRFDEIDLPIPEHGTGALVPPETAHPRGARTGERFLTTALTFLDRKWPQLKVEGSHLLRVHMGRIDDPRTTKLSDDELIDRAFEELTILVGTRAGPTSAAVVRWENSLPQYRVNHLARVAAIENAVQRFPALDVAGAAYRGVGVPACVGSGRRAGQRVKEAVTLLRP